MISAIQYLGMEDIQTNFDKIMAQFNDSVAHTAPKKLSFDNLNESLNDSCVLSKKRRLSHSANESSLNDSTANVSSEFLPPPASPWESRRMKADLIEAKARIAKFKQEIERQHKVRTEVETLYESKVRELTKQCDFSSNKILDLEKHLTVVRKREQCVKQDFTKASNELNKQKHSYEEKIHKLQQTNEEIEENSRLTQNSLENELSEYRSLSQKLEMELDLVSEEFETLKDQTDEYKEKASRYDALKLDFEKEQQALQQANSRVKELEYEIGSYADWKEITKNAQARLLSIPEREKEIERLKANNKNLHEALGNKLLLEEQVHDLRTRLENAEVGKNDAVTLQVKLKNVEGELKEWVKVAQDHCSPNTLVSPIALRARIEEILQNDIIMTSEKSTSLCEKNSIETQLLDNKLKVEMYSKNIESLQTALKRHKNIVQRVQKKLMLVAKERDCYKQLLENFEKDLTISNTLEVSNSEMQLRCRLEMLEKTLIGYKDMCANLEKELNNSKLLPPDQLMETALNNESYEHFKNEIDNLRLDNERLNRRKEELELELEHRCLKGDFNLNKYKVVHFTKNPAAEAYDNANNCIEKLQAEIERLKRRNKKLEEDQEVTARLNETSNMTMNIKEMNQLRAELDSLGAKMKKMKDFYKSASMEFREVCYMLLGYKIDRINHNSYTVSSMYAESADDYLSFRLNDTGTLDMLENAYSISLNALMESHLIANRSLPTFLSTLTLELFNRTTMA